MLKINPKKIVCVFAHPDDEAFGPGGAIAHFIKKGVEITLVCVTNGDAEEKFAGENVSGIALGKIRRAELQSSSRVLGIKDVIFLNFKDGSLCNNNYHDVSGEVQVVLDRIKPDTILTFDCNGVTGHLDHIAVSMECTFLFERLSYIKNIIYYCASENEKRTFGKDYFVYFPDGYKSSDVDMIINTENCFEVKKASMLAHKTQKNDAASILGYFENNPKEEYFRIKSKE